MNRLSLTVKRFMDISLCGAVFILASPLFLVIPILIKLSSAGPIFFVQSRVGQNRKTFNLIKFRTMRPTSKKQALNWSKEEEERITPIGRFFRDYGLDELPQLYNILKGDMSIIGPRALLPVTADQISPQDHNIFLMKPGVLSLAAISGRRSIPMSKRIELHVKYVDEWSLTLDLKILWKSLFVVLFCKDANEIITEPKCKE